MASKIVADCSEGIILVDESEEDIVTRHKKERKDLQAQAVKLKHGVPKGDRKKKKEVTEQIAKLEAELETRQNEELKNLKPKQEVSPAAKEQNTILTSTEIDTTLPNTEKDTTLHLNSDEEIEPNAGGEFSIETGGKKSKAQKRRDKKQAKDRDRKDRIKEQDVINRQGPRQQEMQKIKALLKQRGLQLYEIPADGNCLYNSVSHQLSINNSKSSSDNLRQMAAEYIRSHRDDFLPFLTNPDTGDALSLEEFERYCDKTANSPTWGGQVELRALSEVLQVPIEVLQAEASSHVIGDNMDGKALTLVYHRHVYRLGEHYNSVLPTGHLSNELDDGEDGIDDKKEEPSIKK